MTHCHCGKPLKFSQCCAPFIEGLQLPATAEQLMRSRYSAYVEGRIDYLGATSQGAALQNFDETRVQNLSNHSEWLGLRVINTKDGQAQDTQGTVEFIARFNDGNGPRFIHEVSQFEKIAGRWFYTRGEHLPIKAGRNDPCPCQSGKKYKKCCGQ